VLQEGETALASGACAPSLWTGFHFHLHAQKFPKLVQNLFLFFLLFSLRLNLCPSFIIPFVSLVVLSLSVSESKSYTWPLPLINKMMGIFLFAIIGAIGAFCQDLHSYGSFSYQGCSSIDPSCFGNALVFSDSRLTPEACQHACQGHQFAALLPE
jgi:hypothetical protein